MPELAVQTFAPVPRRRRPLKTARDIKRELARLYWELREGEVDPALGGKLAFVLMSLCKVVEVADIEMRLDRLEDDADEKRPQTH